MSQADPGGGAPIAQAGVIAFLSAPGAFAATGEAAERHDTHGAHVFLAGDLAIKIKRAIRYAYFDFSTLAKRRAALERELAINQANAPEIYLDVAAITREADGRIAIGGMGETVEWCLRMRRFEQAALLSNLARQGLGDDVLKALADEVDRSHRAALLANADKASATAGPTAIIEEIASALEHEEDLAAQGKPFRVLARSRLHAQSQLLERRAAAGKIRRCHGDMHLDNIVMWKGQPTLFDALEFDEALATVDTLYDLAFLLMDLDIRATRTAANRVLNRYLWRTQDMLDLEGLAVLPLFLSLRAGVRAMVALQRGRLLEGVDKIDCARLGRRYLDAALGYLDPPTSRLVAVGGFSGTGKSTLAGALAPRIGPAPGALHLRSDLERKALFGVEELARLDDATYARAHSAEVYGVVAAKARAALAAGHAVVADAVFLSPDERAAIEDVARSLGVPFQGLWLEAGPAEMKRRVANRSGDASDATAAVVERQVHLGAGAIGWTVIDASGSAADTTTNALEALGGVVAVAVDRMS